jgi:hypothetical protein
MTKVHFKVFNLLSKRDINEINKILNDPHVSILRYEVKDNNAIGLRLILQWAEEEEPIPKIIEKSINLIPEEEIEKFPKIEIETREERRRKMKQAKEMK